MRALVLLLASALTACGGGGSGPAPGPLTVEINADSICSGTGNGTPCRQLLPPEWVVDDRAVGGLTLHSLYSGYAQVWVGGPLGPHGVQQRFDQTEHPSHIVVISMGANDAYEARDPAVFEAELRSILMHLISLGKIPIVTGIVPFEPGATFDAGTVERTKVLDAITARVAEELGVRNARWALGPFDTRTDTVDGMHRTVAALRILVQRLRAAIGA